MSLAKLATAYHALKSSSHNSNCSESSDSKGHWELGKRVRIFVKFSDQHDQYDTTSTTNQYNGTQDLIAGLLEMKVIMSDKSDI
jgi:hypothetical protein